MPAAAFINAISTADVPEKLDVVKTIPARLSTWFRANNKSVMAPAIMKHEIGNLIGGRRYFSFDSVHAMQTFSAFMHGKAAAIPLSLPSPWYGPDIPYTLKFTWSDHALKALATLPQLPPPRRSARRSLGHANNSAAPSNAGRPRHPAPANVVPNPVPAAHRTSDTIDARFDRLETSLDTLYEKLDTAVKRKAEEAKEDGVSRAVKKRRVARVDEDEEMADPEDDAVGRAGWMRARVLPPVERTSSKLAAASINMRSLNERMARLLADVRARRAA